MKENNIKETILKSLKDEQKMAIDKFAGVYNTYISDNIDNSMELYEDNIEEAKNDIDHSIDYLEEGVKELFEKYNVSKDDQEHVQELINNLINDTGNLDEVLEGSEEELRENLQFNEDNAQYFKDHAIIERIKDSVMELYDINNKIDDINYQIKYYSDFTQINK